MKKKIIVLMSGGLDSTSLLFDLIASGNDCKALSVHYGQRHARELEAAKKICGGHKIPHQVVDLSALLPLLKGSSQTDPRVAVPHGHYAEESMKLTVVPNRNMILLAVAGAYAISERADAIAYAAHAGDHAVYPDCREEFVRPLADALVNADWHAVGIARPYLKMTKGQVCEAGYAAGAPLHLTYSCYEGEAIHCGKCGTCVERKEAFVQANVQDLTQYKA